MGDSITGADLRGPFTAYGSDEEDFEGTVEITELGNLFAKDYKPPKEPKKRTYNVIVEEGPKRYYPFQLEGLLGEEVANLGFAMEKSDVAPILVEYGLKNFSNSKIFVIGLGTNDFGIFSANNQEITAHILSNFQEAYEQLEKNSKQMIMLSLPPVCGKFDDPYPLVAYSNEVRRAHNNELESFCLERKSLMWT